MYKKRQLIHSLVSLGLLSLLSACGDNTNQSPIKDVSSIKINESNISMYSTDINKKLTGSALYTDGTRAIVTDGLEWSTNGSTAVLSTTGLIYPNANSGDANISINYQNKFSDTQAVHIKQLQSLSATPLDLNSTVAQTISVYGNFENNETNVTMLSHTTWSTDANATIGAESNASSITITLDSNVSSLVIKAKNFSKDLNLTFP